jgi:carboxyl-terminal processing protease
MKRAKVMTPSASAWARKSARNSGDAEAGLGDDEPIYKRMRMATVGVMFKRILTLISGATLGVAFTVAAARVATAWNIWPNRDLARSSGYVKDVMRLVNENYVDERAVGYDQLARSALHGLVETLDPHSEFLEKKENDEFEEDLTGEFGGVGIQVETRQNRIVVIAPLAGTPSERAGVQRGDEIVSIDGKALDANGNVDSVVTRLRGKPKTPVQVSFYRPSTKETLNLSLVREIIKIESVRGVRLLEDGIGYVQLSEFSDHTAEQFLRAVDKLLKQGMQSLVIDVRNNPGGLLDAAVEVVEPFFKKKELIVYTKGRKPSDREEFRARSEGPPLSLPIAVLINAGSASAAEIVTGALKDTGRAIVVGERSFGKGSVQSVFKLENGEGLRLTTARYYTPSGATIHERGILPHVEVVMTPEEDNRLARQRARPDITDPVAFKERFGFDPVVDRQLETAVAMLKGVRYFEERGPVRPSQ